MTKGKRVNFNEPGTAHELTFSCYKRMMLVQNDRSCEWFVQGLATAREELDFSIWAYVVMPEHVHVLLWPRGETHDISKIRGRIREIVSRKAIAYLKKHKPSFLPKLELVRPSGRVRHQFWQQGKGFDRNMFSPDAIRDAINYIHNNPIRRGLVQVASDWKWSSFGWYAGEKDVPLEMDPYPRKSPRPRARYTSKFASNGLQTWKSSVRT